MTGIKLRHGLVPLFSLRSALPFILALYVLISLAACGNTERAKQRHLEKGEILARRGRYADAVNEYEKALAIDPKMAEARFQIGKCYSGLQHWEEAIASLDRARHLEPKAGFKALVAIADVYAVTNRGALAEQACQEALEINSDGIDAILFLGKLKLSRNNYREARSFFEKAIAISPGDMTARMMLAEMSSRDGQYDVAEGHLRKIEAKSDSEQEAVELAIAKVYRFSDREDEAIQMLRHCIERNPNSVTARGALAEAYLAVNRLSDARKEAETYLKMSPASAQGSLLLGTILLKQGEYGAAVDSLAKAASSPSASSQTYHLYGLALKGTSNLAQAIAAFHKALASDPNNTSCRLTLAQTLLVEGSFETAQREIGLVLSREPDNEYARQLWVQANALRQAFEQMDSLLASQGIPEAAAEDFKAALKALRAGDLQRAQQLCEKPLRDIPDSPLFLNMLGLVHLKRNDLEQALRYFNRAVRKDPRFVASYVNMANVYLALGNNGQAVQTYQKAMELAPKDQMIPLKFSRALLLMKRHKEAETVLKRLVQANPKKVAYRMALADLYLSTNRYSNAREELSEIFKLEAKNVPAAYIMAQTLAREGNIAKAAASFQTLLRASPPTPDFKAGAALCELVQGHPDKAQEILAAAPVKYERGSAAELVSALAMAAMGQYKKAGDILAPAGSAASAETTPQLALANILTAQGNRREAIELVRQSSGFSKPFKLSYARLLETKSLAPNELNELNLAITLTQFHWNRLAMSRFESVLSKVGANPAILEMLAGIEEKEGNGDKAVTHYEAALSAEPSYWPARYRLGVKAFDSGQTSQAEQYFRESMKQEPDSILILLALARVLQKQGNDAEAIKTYQRIDESRPNLPVVMNNLAWLLAKNPRTLDRALGYARSAVASQPSNADFCDTIGWIYFQKNDHASAKKYLEKAVFFDSLNSTMLYHRGMVSSVKYCL